MGASLGDLKVVAESATAKNDDVVIISKETLKPKSSDKYVYMHFYFSILSINY